MIDIFDTDHFCFCEISDSPENRAVIARVLQLEAGDRVVTSIITYEEQTRGIAWLHRKVLDLNHQFRA